MNRLPTLLHETLSISTERYPEKSALICNDQICTYRQLDEQSTQLAIYLQKMGLQPQDRVAVFTDNSIETVISLYGILKAGGVFLILNGGLKSSKLAYILNNSGTNILITQASKHRVFMETVEKANHPVRIICVHHEAILNPQAAEISIPWDSVFTDANSTDTLCPPATNTNDLASLIYTSGSTGDPKGVMCSHSNMVSAADSIIQYLENTPDDIILNVLPLSFDYGLYQVLMSVFFGGTTVLGSSFVYIHRVLEQIARWKVTGFPIVPTIVAMLLNMQNLDRYDFSSVRYLTNTGAAFPVNHIKRLRQLLPNMQIYSMFGLTECKRVCYLPPEQVDIRPDSVGKPMPNCTTYVLDENDQPVEPDQVGELVIEGPNVMQGYWQDPELTAKTYRTDSDGTRRLYSGDYFKQDAEGFLYFLGRKDDMIKTRGERVSPKEVENALSEIDGVGEVAVIGVDDDILGQVVKAFIVSRDGVELTEQNILAAAAKTMEKFMVPKYIEILTELPKSHHGKIDKKVLVKREKTAS